MLLPLLRHVVPLNDGNCTLPREALPHAFDISVFEYGKSSPTTIKHIYIESEKLNESCDVAFDNNNWWNLPQTVPVIGVVSMVTRAGFRYTRDYLTPDLCSLIKPAAMDKIDVISRQNPHSHVTKEGKRWFNQACATD